MLNFTRIFRRVSELEQLQTQTSSCLKMSFVIQAIDDAREDIIHHVLIRECVRDLVFRVEEISAASEIKRTREELELSVSFMKRLACIICDLEDKNQLLLEDASFMRNRTEEVRNSFVNEIAMVLEMNRKGSKMKEEINALKKKTKDQKNCINDLEARNTDTEMQLKYQQQQWEREIEILQAALANANVRTQEALNDLGAGSVILCATGSAHDIAASVGKGSETDIVPVVKSESCAEVHSEQMLGDALLDPKQMDPLVGMPEEKNAAEAPPSIRHCLLLDIGDIELLHVSSFLSTTEVLTAAQANRFLFQRIDTLFGLESKVALASWATRTSAADPATVAEAAIEVKADSTVRPVDNAPRDAGTADKAIGSEPTRAAAAPSGVVSYLSSLTSTIANTFLPPELDEIDEMTGILPEGAINLLRSKLSTAEMSAVIHLNNCAIKQLSVARERQVEMDDMQARLLSTESVRDFLVAKLKEAELALKAALREGNRLRRQAQADAEVISFLDLQGQEQEGKVTFLEQSTLAMQATLQVQASNHEQIVKQHMDDIAALRRQLEELESTHKSTKKVLVKEVKTLRQTLDSTATERDVLRAHVRIIQDNLNGVAGLWESKTVSNAKNKRSSAGGQSRTKSAGTAAASQKTTP